MQWTSKFIAELEELEYLAHVFGLHRAAIELRSVASQELGMAKI